MRKKEVAEAVIDSLIEEHSPMAILLVGSVAIGFADNVADIDIIIVNSKLNYSDRYIETITQFDESISIEHYQFETLNEITSEMVAGNTRKLNRLRLSKILYNPD